MRNSIICFALFFIGLIVIFILDKPTVIKIEHSAEYKEGYETGYEEGYFRGEMDAENRYEDRLNGYDHQIDVSPAPSHENAFSFLVSPSPQ